IMQVLSAKYLIRPIHYEGLQRKEPLEIPKEALREIIFNSIVHKLQSGTWNQMSIYDDHIHLWNEGELPDGYTVETLMSKHISKPRNPKIARAFYLAGFIEAWGRGYEKIMSEFDKVRLARPTFKEEQRGICVDIPREIFMSIRGGLKSTKDSHGANCANGANGAENGANLTARQAEIVSIIKRNPSISLNEIAAKLGVGTTTVDREVKKLKGVIKRVGARNGGYWEIIES
ncbi:MAG TPA: HTH domain-containing protein, partial [Candidatus Amulumruptor caecigallinarius]|nr:HTH domain-containing protein [Candidatus Amulumruptor caecigallinarius]